MQQGYGLLVKAYCFMLILNSQYQQPLCEPCCGPATCCCAASCEEQSYCNELALTVEQQYACFWVLTWSSIGWIHLSRGWPSLIHSSMYPLVGESTARVIVMRCTTSCAMFGWMCSTVLWTSFRKSTLLRSIRTFVGEVVWHFCQGEGRGVEGYNYYNCEGPKPCWK